MKEEYIELLKITNRNGIDKLIQWLEQTDFFTAPASTKYHLSKKGGLLEHSLNVYDELVNEYGVSDSISSLIIVALLHDICKANFYSISERNVKKVDGKWIKEPYYTVEDQFPVGHGEKSVMIIQKFIKLTDEEIAAIRWHMGAYEPKESYNSLSRAFSKYPLALMLHIADLKATYIREKGD